MGSFGAAASKSADSVNHNWKTLDTDFMGFPDIVSQITVDCPSPTSPGKCDDLKYMVPETDQDRLNCCLVLKKKVNDNKHVARLRGLLQAKGCSVPDPECKKCTGPCEGPDSIAMPTEEGTVITFCTNGGYGEQGADANAAAALFAHELVHALQICTMNNGWPTICDANDLECECRMKMEIQAYMIQAAETYGDELYSWYQPDVFLYVFPRALWSACMMKQCSTTSQGIFERLYHWFYDQDWTDIAPE